jgi:hypothetical protein
VRAELKRISLLTLTAGVALFCLAERAEGQGTAVVMTSKSIPPATVAVIDPETGTSSGSGGSSDILLAVGDIISFRLNYTPVSKQGAHGMQGYVTEYIPANTEVVGVRIISHPQECALCQMPDTTWKVCSEANLAASGGSGCAADGHGGIATWGGVIDCCDDSRAYSEEYVTVPPRYPGISVDSCKGGCPHDNTLPCDTAFTPPQSPLCSTGTRNVPLGSVSQLYADTGVFYSVESSTAREPWNAFISLNDGYWMSPEPGNVNDIVAVLGAGDELYAHNLWDRLQMYGYGSTNGEACNSKPCDATPHGFGSPVAGDGTWYKYEATGTLGSIEFNDDPGPWERIQYTGSLIGTGTTGGDGGYHRTVLDYTAGQALSPGEPLPWDDTGGPTTNAVRVALGEVRVGEPGTVEITLRVKDTPIDPDFGDTLTEDGPGADVNCGEYFGSDISAESEVDATVNPWQFFLPSPACVYLKLLFDINVDRPLASSTSDVLTYTLRVKNLSLNPETGVVVRMLWTGDLDYIEGTVTGSPAPDTIDGTCGGYSCMVWDLGILAPSDEYEFTAQFNPVGLSGGGEPTAVMRADYDSGSTDEPFYYENQAVTVTKGVCIMDASMMHTDDPVPVNGSTTFYGTIANTSLASGGGDVDSFTVYLPPGWQATSDIGWTSPTASNYCDAISDNELYCPANQTLLPGQALTFTFTADADTDTGLFDLDLQIWGSQGSFGSFEKYFPDVDSVVVGAARSDPPVVDCPISRISTSVTGTTTEANGTVIRLFLNGSDAGSDLAAGGSWEVDTSAFGELYYGLEVRATAKAPGKLESELSEPCIVGGVQGCSDGLDNDGDTLTDFPNDPGCSSYFDETEDPDPECWDTLDNDGDGDTDWPADLECWGPYDDAEAGTEACRDGIDNDGNGYTDWAGSDPGCDSATDRIEASARACQNGINDDGSEDGLIDGLDHAGDPLTDFPHDPGCHSPNDDSETDEAMSTTDIRARLLLVFDTSGSMNFNTCFSNPYDHDNNPLTPPISPFTGGDGSVECSTEPDDDYDCSTYPGCTPSGCSNGEADDSRLYKAKIGMTDAIDAYGEVQWGLMRFYQKAFPFKCPIENAAAQSGGWQGAGGDCGETCDPQGDTCTDDTFNKGELLVAFAEDNQYSLLEWMDQQSNYPGGSPPPGMDFELRGSGTTPLAGALISARTYLEDAESDDPVRGCRPYRVILITDGLERCNIEPGDYSPADAASDLLHAGDYAGYQVHVIGFAIDDPALDAIAAAGGTGAAIPVYDEAELSATIASIVFESLLIEECNGIDDDCDGFTDETFPEQGERCDTPFQDADSDGVWDHGDVWDAISETGCSVAGDNPCGECQYGEIVCTNGELDCAGAVGPDPAETCNCEDDDCDGEVDEGLGGGDCGTDTGECVAGTLECLNCVEVCTGEVGPSTEICDNKDNDCDGLTDADDSMTDARLGGSCGTDTGVCTAGTWICVDGEVVCSGDAGTDEICDGLDNNCDGLTDEVVEWCLLPIPGYGGNCDPNEQCGICRAGYHECIEDPGNPGEYIFDDICHGQVGPSTEVCDGKDNDCDGYIDDSDADPNQPLTRSCGTDVGECVSGVQECVSGGWSEGCGGTYVGPGEEQCDGLDNDCDGAIDESDPNYPIGDPCNTSGLDLCDDGGASTDDACGQCRLGTWNCVDAGTDWEVQCTGMVLPVSPDNCDGLDNDCDGQTDEDEPSRNCGSDLGACEYGSQACQGAGGVPDWGPCLDGTDAVSEICDGLDNDCDGATDETFPRDGLDCNDSGTDFCDNGDAATDDACGICSLGIWQCVDGGEVCSGMIPPQSEVCDGWDNDCDGRTDESDADSDQTMTQECGKDVGICTLGLETCMGANGHEAWGPCSGEAGTDESCNGFDDDCDGFTDEEFPGQGDACTDGGPDLCTTDPDPLVACGECSAGTIQCPNGTPVCLGVVPPSTEICDNRDNDCDGQTDESFAGMGEACDSATDADFCPNGTWQCQCVGMSCQVACAGDANIIEVCDGNDNDCDGATDETFPRDGQPCNESGENLCDASTDPLVACGQCRAGIWQCVDGGEVCSGVVIPQTEVCDGWDNDCDSYTDEDPGNPAQTMTRVCGKDTGVCTLGTETCLGADGAELWSACTGDAGTDEICNNLDDDCDGSTDETFPESGMACRKVAPADGWGDADVDLCPGTATPTDDVCGTCLAGNWVCDDDGTLRCAGAVGPEASDLCDGWDNDCDTETDEDEPTQPCGDDTGECELGTRACEGADGIPLWGDCLGATDAASELCDNLDNNCDGRTDEDNPEGGAECDLAGLLTDVMLVCSIEDSPGHYLPCGECQYGTTVCVQLDEDPWAELQCLDTVGPVTEICDNKDNDCDGLTDNDDGDMDDDRLGGACGSDVGECIGGSWICSDQGEVVCLIAQGPTPELCDGKDNDCDGQTDEQTEVEQNEADIGLPCREECLTENPDDCVDILSPVMEGADGCSREDPDHPGDALYDMPCGACRLGALACIQVDEGVAAVLCMGAQGPDTELCDGIDNDCDGLTDTDDPGMDDPAVGVVCPEDVVGECTQGISACVDGEIVCQGGQGPVDEICDGKDNDCDGVTDEGIPLGGACGTDVGECRPGIWACCTEELISDGECEVIGEVICLGGVEPINELCDGLDNDCDGEIDETEDITRYDDRLGQVCGSETGECEPGVTQCVDNDVICVGEIPPAKERCDCKDNDCDGLTDEDEDMCPPEAICVDCQCAWPCRPAEEFSESCPAGKSAKDFPGLGCYCVKEICTFENCSPQVIERDGETMCAPESSKVGHCICSGNECTFPCDGVTCESGMKCDPRDGICRQNTCAIFGCDEGERCEAETGSCEPDPCAEANCADDEACRDGECFKSCSSVQCQAGQKCVQGKCVDDPCAGVSCGPNEVCDPEDGACVDNQCVGKSCPEGFVCDPLNGNCEPDPCLITTCPEGEFCQDGECTTRRCPGGKIECEDRCIDPMTDTSFCGASGDCRNGNAGVECPEGQVCSNGVCSETCDEGYIICGGSCVDPLSDREYCGASGDCQGENAGNSCAEGEVCVNGVCSTRCLRGQLKCGGECIDPATDEDYCGATGCEGAAAGRKCAEGETCVNGICTAADRQTDETTEVKHRAVSAAGGGCSCTVPAGARSVQSERGAWALLLALLGLVGFRLGRRSRLSSRGLATTAVNLLFAALLLTAALSVSGCKVDPFCLDCEEPEEVGGADGGQAETGPGPQQSEAGPPVPVDAGADADAGRPEGCLDHELCNGEDDDCDGDTDEDFDLNSNINHCGSCEISCLRDHAYTECKEGVCEMSGCDLAFVDLDGDEENGCEYYCLKEMDDDARCDLRDNDCDGEIDEDVDLSSDKNNCGSCGFVCKFARAAEGASCVNGKCVLDSSKCDEGYYDIDGNDANGCEYECTPDDPPDEVCDLEDNNCDGQVDEGDPGGGALCGGADGLGAEVGECRAGVETCANGDVICDGGIIPDTEVCDGLDNDCDGETDEGIAGVGPSFKCDGPDSDQCPDGNRQCRLIGDEYQILCVEEGVEILPLDDVEICDGLDNDCDGIRDEGNPGGGMPCNHVWDPDATTDGGAWVPVDLCPGTDAVTDDVCGVCSAGTWQCGFGGLYCDGTVVPQAVEVCDGLDNDCNGLVDDGVVAGTGAACDGADSDKCQDGIWLCRQVGNDSKIMCVEDDTTNDPDPVDDVEICDGLDNDCDSAVDEDYPGKGDDCNDTGTDLCDDGGTDTADACGQCGLGKMTCVEVTAGQYQVICVGEELPDTEICDGLDNDCDGMTDETAAGDPMTRACGSGTGECVVGYRTCTGSDGKPSWSATCHGEVVPDTEVCDGKDNDCDGATDESFPGKGDDCNDSGSDLCGTSDVWEVACGICVPGSLQCEDGVTDCVGEVLPEDDDVCDGYDNDCDGHVDNGTYGDPTVLTKVCGKSVGVCETGTQTCTGSGGVPSWTACSGGDNGTDEICNGLDDDCDGATDEDYPEKGLDCNSPYDDLCPDGDSDSDEVCGICRPGTWSCAGTSGPVCSGKVLPGTEVCDNLDNDCDGDTDEEEELGFTTCGLGECEHEIDNCVDGVPQFCNPFDGATEETCNGLDDDCDGATDEWFPGKGDDCNDSGSDLCGTSGVNEVACGICQPGKWQCVGGAPVCVGEVLPDDEDMCDGYDNDCDGYTDNVAYGDSTTLTKVCGTGVGVCSTGTQECDGSGGVPSWTACAGGDSGTDEICDGLDNDCDGATDEDYPGKGLPCNDPYDDLCPDGDSDTDEVCGTCRPGTWTCAGTGGRICSGKVLPGTEVCDDRDNDCDGLTDELLGQTSCGLGECAQTIDNCVDGVPQFCNPFDGASDEICDGLDNNCNGAVDEWFPEINDDCQHEWDAVSEEWVPVDLCLDDPAIDVCGTCAQGRWYCIGATLECLGMILPGVESCNYLDDDCDADTDEDFDFSSVNSCGDCDTVCSMENAYPSCDGVSCSYQCWPGYVDDPYYDADSDGDPLGDDCTYECMPSGDEVCNGLDDDCDMEIDDADSDMVVPDVATFCKSYGVCGSGAVTLSCDHENGWQCNYGLVDDYQDPETWCDGLDNDCDGKTDEWYSNIYPEPAPCSKGTGGCRGDGFFICDPGDRTAPPVCDAVTDTPDPEICNAVDDDCDGKVDEPCPGPTADAETDGSSCVQDAWVYMPDGYYIYAYEAVRPDAGWQPDASTDVYTGDPAQWSAGKSAARACSRPGVDDGALPWTNVTYPQAQAACQKAGARLCTESEWVTACVDPDCYWCFADGVGGIDCQVYEMDLCNGNDFDADTDLLGDQDMVHPTGWFDYCYRDHTGGGGTGLVYDMSGNVKEWVERYGDAETDEFFNPLRGGAMDNTDRGIACDFDFVLARHRLEPDDDPVNPEFPLYSYTNAGFRCCWTP